MNLTGSLDCQCEKREREANGTRQSHAGDEHTCANGANPRHEKCLNFQRIAGACPPKTTSSITMVFSKQISHLHGLVRHAAIAQNPPSGETTCPVPRAWDKVPVAFRNNASQVIDK